MLLVTNSEGRPGVGRTAELLAQGARGLDAIEAGIRLVEADPSIRTVGRGGWPNLLGEVELDAAIMDGDTLRTGAIGAVQGYRHPISIARQVLERLPHELLVGAGAQRFAQEIGADREDNLIENSRQVWEKWQQENVTGENREKWPDIPLAELCRQAIDPETGRDTTVFIAVDANGTIASGVSTSGWGWKYPGRLGDSPVIGAGSYADSAFGAAACTGAGEMTIRANTARATVLYMKMGLSLDAAVMEAVADMRRLKGGLIDRVTLHALDRFGNHKVVGINAPDNLSYYLWQQGDDSPKQMPVEPVAL